MDPHKFSSEPKESVAPSRCAVVMTTCPHSTLSHTASQHPEDIEHGEHYSTKKKNKQNLPSKYDSVSSVILCSNSVLLALKFLGILLHMA